MEKPSHIAIIMDGNGRWAQRNGYPRREGHKKGVKTLKNIVKICYKYEIPCLTVYAFSTENWKRPGPEVDFLMKLFHKTLLNEAEELNENNVRIKIIGRRDKLSCELLNAINNIEQLTSKNDGLLLNIALNYGGRAEIIDVVKRIYNELDEDKIDNLDVELFNKYLYNPEYPEVELLIRSGGEKRLSNFLLWEIAYAELYTTEKYWPEFDEDDLKEALIAFNNRDRRFGGIK